MCHKRLPTKVDLHGNSRWTKQDKQLDAIQHLVLLRMSRFNILGYFSHVTYRGSLYPESFPKVHGFVSARKSPDINTNMMYSCSHSPCLNSASSAHTGTLISAPISCDLGAWSITSTPYFKTVGDALSSTHPEHHAFPNHPRNAHHALKHSTPFLHS